MNKKLILSAAICAAVVSTNANAVLMTFDDLSSSPARVEDGYHGFDWSDFDVFGVNVITRFVGTGFDYGTVSEHNVLSHTTAAVHNPYISRSEPFDLNSLYITRSKFDEKTIIEGYSNGVLVHRTGIETKWTEPTFVELNWPHIDKFLVVRGTRDFAVIDNLDYTVSVVPEPSTYAMLLAGLGLVGFMGKRIK